MGLRSMTEGFRHLRGQKLLSATYWIDLNAMIFGMPRAVFPALGHRPVRRRCRRGRTALRRPGRRVAGRLAVHRVVQPGPPPGPGHRRLRDGLGGDHRPVRDHPGAVDRPDAAGPGRRGRRGVGRLPPGRPAAGGARAPPGPALGDVLRRGGRGPSIGRRRDRGWRRPSAARSSPCGRAAWPAWSASASCSGGSPSCGGTTVGAAALSAEAETEAIAEVTTELGRRRAPLASPVVSRLAAGGGGTDRLKWSDIPFVVA